MKSFQCVVHDENGLHARPAGLFVKAAQQYDSKITVSANGRSADAKKLFAVMGLAVKQGTNITLIVEGSDEAKAAVGFEAFLKNNL
jgi:phosphocarrier protein HPr